MKQLLKQVFEIPTLLVSLISIAACAQIQKKTFSESFDVLTDAVLDINTSHADIEFESWGKDKVSIEATIVLEGASEEEAKYYFENEGFDILGNSERVTITTNNEKSWAFKSMGQMDKNLLIELSEMPEFELFEFDFDFSDMEDLPIMPPVPNPNFDYEAFKQDGEKYMKKWQKNFQKDFGEPYQKRMEEWRQKMEAKKNEMRESREKIQDKRAEVHSEHMEKMAEARAERAQKRMEAHQERMANHQARIAQRENLYNRSNIFYFNSEGENRSYKVKKTIKIKLPKSMRIKMNVRHGEVKLAENTTNIDATLSYASLLAATIDGDETIVMASYSPVSVEKWNYGQLQTDYSDNVDLKEVLNLRLSATSSEVTIENLINTAFIKNSFGPLFINTVSKDFETLDVSLQNSELVCDLPESSFSVYVNGTISTFDYPPELALSKTNNHGSVVYKGYNRSKDSDRSVNINSKYSEVLLK